MDLVLDQLEEDGFAVVRGVADAREVMEMASAFDRLLALARAHGHGVVDGTHFVVGTDPFRLHRVVWAGGVEPVLARWGADPRVVGLAQAALRSDTVMQLIQQAHFKLPGDGVAFQWHQDASNRRYGTDQWTDVDGRGSFVQIAIAVDEMSADNGGLRVIRGSHRLGFVAELGTGVVAERYLDGEVVDLELAPGDAVLFGPFAIHGSGPNQGAISRRLFLQGYAVPGANYRVYPGSGLGIARR